MSAEPTRRTRSPGVLVAVCLAVLLSAAPGVAAAEDPSSVKPRLDCARTNSDGSVTAVLGYVNPGNDPRTIPHGPQNVLSPSGLDGAQPTTFLRGPHRGVFSLTVPEADLADAVWTLDGNTLDYSTIRAAATCSPSTPLPAMGNGTGMAVALVGGGAFGVFFVRRLIRRSAATG